ncbi:MAG: hypothetical protein KGY80_10110 [Candidatus Thorarchaeota archaeon]|nr:hypothetical protein [Candidatus Thorarchaeota archaeon]
MNLFSEDQVRRITDKLNSKKGSVLITFRNPHGPTRLKKLWEKTLSEIGYNVDCINWWSSSGIIGLLECEIEDGSTIYGQWALGDKVELYRVENVSEDDIVSIKDGLGQGNIASSAMRSMRIGETGEG